VYCHRARGKTVKSEYKLRAASKATGSSLVQRFTRSVGASQLIATGSTLVFRKDNQILNKQVRFVALTQVAMKNTAFLNVMPCILVEVYRLFRETYHANFWVLGRAIAQAVSRRLPTATARVRAQVRSCGICGGRSGTGAGSLRFPLPILIPPTVPHSSSIIRGWYNRPVSGRRTKSHSTPRN
jgi:hypothetical protein